MSGVDEGDVADADVLCLLDGEIHGGASEDDGESLVGVDDGGGRGLSKDAPPGICLDAAVAVALYIYLDHVGDAVALDAPEVGSDEGLDGGVDVVGRLSHLGEDGGEGTFKGLVGDADLVFGGYFEAFEHFCIFRIFRIGIGVGGWCWGLYRMWGAPLWISAFAGMTGVWRERGWLAKGSADEGVRPFDRLRVNGSYGSAEFYHRQRITAPRMSVSPRSRRW